MGRLWVPRVLWAVSVAVMWRSRKCARLNAWSSRRDFTRGRPDLRRPETLPVTLPVTRKPITRCCMGRTFSPNCKATCLCVWLCMSCKLAWPLSTSVKRCLMAFKVLPNNSSDCVTMWYELYPRLRPNHAFARAFVDFQSYAAPYHTSLRVDSGCRKERNVLFNDALNTFYLRLCDVRHMVKDNSDSEKGNPLPPHRLLFPISNKGSFICTTPHTGYHIPQRLLHKSWSTGWNEK